MPADVIVESALHIPALITWPDPLVELLGFLGTFLTAGAIGFRFAALRGLPGAPGPEDERSVLEHAARRAAGLGLSGAVLATLLLGVSLPASARRAHAELVPFVLHDRLAGSLVAITLLTLAGFALARRASGVGWWVAAFAVTASPLRGLLTGHWERLVNPLHRFAGGMWIGTLFVLVTAGIAVVLGSTLPAGRRGALVARMVNGFSRLALASAVLLVVMGVITAWRHLQHLAALWTTPYGWALIVKLVLVAGVVALGTWNWRRQKPRLGSFEGAQALRRSAGFELALAGVVLLVTAILVSLPSPR